MRLSIVVTIVNAGAALRRCLSALASRDDPPVFEVIVPFDSTVADVEAFRTEFPDFEFLALGYVATKHPPMSPSGQHKLFDRRRTAGLAAAEGELVAIVEDRGVPQPDWAQVADRLHRTLGTAVAGGAIENGVERWLNWAVYFCDFGCYQAPFEQREAAYVSDVNICYARRALESTRELWSERYHETTVHWALQRAGEELMLSPDLVVDQNRDGLRLGSLLPDRVYWGRLFAHTRAQDVTRICRLFYVVVSPPIPLVLFARLARVQIARCRTRLRTLWAAPVVAVLLLAWSAREAACYLTGKG